MTAPVEPSASSLRGDRIVATIAVIAIGAPAALALASGEIVLFASLGPSAVMQAHRPTDRSARLYNVIVSHILGALAGAGSVAVLGLAAAPSVFALGTVTPSRVAAALLAIAVGTFLELRLRATHPPAASTTLLMALGSFHPTLHDFAVISAGVGALGFFGELLRRGMALASQPPRRSS